MFRSGLEEEHDEKMVLLQNISDMIKDRQLMSNESTIKRKKQLDMEQGQAKTIRDAATKGIQRGM